MEERLHYADYVEPIKMYLSRHMYTCCELEKELGLKRNRLWTMLPTMTDLIPNLYETDGGLLGLTR